VCVIDGTAPYVAFRQSNRADPPILGSEISRVLSRQGPGARNGPIAHEQNRFTAASDLIKSRPAGAGPGNHAKPAHMLPTGIFNVAPQDGAESLSGTCGQSHRSRSAAISSSGDDINCRTRARPRCLYARIATGFASRWTRPRPRLPPRCFGPTCLMQRPENNGLPEALIPLAALRSGFRCLGPEGLCRCADARLTGSLGARTATTKLRIIPR